MSRTKAQLVKLVKSIPEAMLKGGVEAGKRSVVTTFCLTALDHLYDECKSVPADQLAHTAREFSIQAPQETASQLQELGVQSRWQIDALSELLHFFYADVAKRDGRLLAMERMQQQMQSEVHAFRVDLPLILDEQRRQARGRDARKFENNYLKEVRAELGYLEIIGITGSREFYPELDIAFVSLDVRREHDVRDYYPTSAENLLSAERQLIIRAPAGGGKTTLMQWSAVQCALGKTVGRPPCDNPWHGYIPFFIRLRKLIRADNPFPPLCDWVSLTLPDWGRQSEQPPGWAQDVLEDGRELLLFDGLDELAQPQRPIFWDGLKKLCHRHRLLRFVVTSRPLPHNKQDEGAWDPPVDTKVADVQPLTPEKINLLIDRWHDAATKREPDQSPARKHLRRLAIELKATLDLPAYVRMRQLAETPFLCAVLCVVHQSTRGHLPTQSAGLYRLCCEALLKLRDVRRRVISRSIYDELSLEDLMIVHGRLALHMVMNAVSLGEAGSYERAVPQKPRTDSQHLVEADFDHALIWLKDCIPHVSNKAVRETGNPRDLLEHMITRRGLLRQPAKERIDFHHRALQEYLAACAIPLTAQMQFLVSLAHDDRWKEIIKLVPGGAFVGVSEISFLVDRLIHRGDTEDSTLCYSLAIACLGASPVRLPGATEKVLHRLERLVPPQNSDDAKVVAAAGDEIIDYLNYKDRRDAPARVAAACAETLVLLGSRAAVECLRAYAEDERATVLEQVCRCSEIGLFEMPYALRYDSHEEQTWVAEFAQPHVRRIAPVADVHSLLQIKSLSLNGCSRLVDLRGISGMIYLQTLNIGGCRILEDLSPLSSLRALRFLYLKRCDVLSSLEPLANRRSLTGLHIEQCPNVTSLAPLAGLVNLSWLSISRCPGITDLTPLLELEKLGRIYIQEGAVKDVPRKLSNKISRG